MALPGPLFQQSAPRSERRFVQIAAEREKQAIADKFGRLRRPYLERSTYPGRPFTPPFARTPLALHNGVRYVTGMAPDTTNAQRQARWRQRQQQQRTQHTAALETRIAELERELARRKQTADREPAAALHNDGLADENAKLKRRVAELERYLARAQNAHSRLSYFHERLKTDRGFLSKKNDALFLNVLHPDRAQQVSQHELTKALALYTQLRDELVIKAPAESKARKAARANKQNRVEYHR
jgi:hypothetical protein